jgi:hypothetical protein
MPNRFAQRRYGTGLPSGELLGASGGIVHRGVGLREFSAGDSAARRRASGRSAIGELRVVRQGTDLHRAAQLTGAGQRQVRWPVLAGVGRCWPVLAWDGAGGLGQARRQRSRQRPPVTNAKHSVSAEPPPRDLPDLGCAKRGHAEEFPRAAHFREDFVQEQYEAAQERLARHVCRRRARRGRTGHVTRPTSTETWTLSRYGPDGSNW